LTTAALIVADVTGRSGNVYYELGIAHTLGKPVIIKTESMRDVLFNLLPRRCLVRKYKPDKMKKFEDELEETIKFVLANDSSESL
jgi:hypothetical protein